MLSQTCEEMPNRAEILPTESTERRLHTHQLVINTVNTKSRGGSRAEEASCSVAVLVGVNKPDYFWRKIWICRDGVNLCMKPPNLRKFIYKEI